MKLIQPIIVNFKLVDKVHFQLRSVHKNEQNHLDWICEVMEGD